MGHGYKAGNPGSAALASLTVTGVKGCSVTISKDGITKTRRAGDDGSAVFGGLSCGTWKVSVTDGTDTKTDTVEVTRNTDKPMRLARIYGIKRNMLSPSPVWERECDAVGLQATAGEKGSSGITAECVSDFDSLYPWSGICVWKHQLHTVTVPASSQFIQLPTGEIKEIVTPEHTVEYFKPFVKIPKFWYRRFYEGYTEHIQIADRETEGFALHPAFDRPGGAVECICIGSFRVSGKLPEFDNALAVSKTRAAMREDIRSNGKGWGILDAASLSAIQMLLLVEYGSCDTQIAIGRGDVDKSSFSADKSRSWSSGWDKITKFSGTDLSSGVSHAVWRGFYGLWGNIREWIDGLNYKDGTYYVCSDPTLYADDTLAGYVPLDYKIDANLTDAYITHMGIEPDPQYSHYLLPVLSCSGSSGSYYCDACTTGAGWRVPAIGCASDEKDKGGLFSIRFESSGTSNTKTGARAQYIPPVKQEVDK